MFESTLKKVPMRFLETGAVLLRPELPPLLCIRWLYYGERPPKYCVFRDLESLKKVTLGSDVIIDGCERRRWEILKRSHTDSL